MNRVAAWPVLGVSVPLSLGLVLGSSVGLPAAGPVLVGVIGLSILGALLSIWRNHDWLLVPLCGIFLALGVGIGIYRSATLPMIVQEQSVEETRAVIVSEPEISAFGSRAFVDVPISGTTVRALAQFPGESVLQYGDVALLSGTLSGSKRAYKNDERYLRAHLAQGRLHADRVEPTGERAGNSFIRMASKIRQWLIDRLRPSLSVPERAVVLGMLFGIQSDFPAELETLFRRTGTSHLIVASGSNVALIAWAAKRFPGSIRFRLGLALACVALFLFVSGVQASIVRASFVITLVFLAELTGRRIHLPTLLSLVLLLMLLLNPWSIHDLSFQLSFAALLGILVAEPYFSRVVPLPAWLLPFVAPSLAAELGVLPVILLQFGTLSPVAPIANTLILPLVPAILVGGALNLLLPGFVLTSWATEGVVTLQLWILQAVNRLPGAYFEVRPQYLLPIATMCLLVGFGIVRHRRRVLVAS